MEGRSTDTGLKYKLVDGSEITDVEVFAGKGVSKTYDRAYSYYAPKFGGRAKDWQHIKGFGFIDVDGTEHFVENHWSECKVIGKVEGFIKEWLD